MLCQIGLFSNNFQNWEFIIITVNLETFNKIKNLYGDCGSWAVWSEEDSTPKSNVGDLSILDPQLNRNLLSLLKPQYVFVGLNFSTVDNIIPLSNFHSSSSKAQDYKIRFALKNTIYWGSYMTDIIKNFEEKHSSVMMEALKKDQTLESKNIEIFINELENLNVTNKQIIAFGNDTYKILKRNLSKKFNIKKIPHYAHFISKENYRKEVLGLISGN